MASEKHGFRRISLRKEGEAWSHPAFAALPQVFNLNEVPSSLDLSPLLLGVPVEYCSEQHLVSVSIGSLSASATTRSLRQSYGYSEYMSLGAALPPAEGGDDDIYSACIRAVSRPDRASDDYAGEDEELCGRLTRGHAFLMSPEEAKVFQSEKVAGDGANRVDSTMTDLGPLGGDAVLHLAGSGGGVYNRSLNVATRSGNSSLFVVLTPDGRIASGLLTQRRAGDRAADTILDACHKFINDRWEIIEDACTTSGEREALLALLSRPPDRSTSRSLATDGSRPPLLAPARALVLEEAIDARDEALAARLLIDETALRAWRFERDFSKSLFGTGATGIQSALELVDDTSLQRTNHGAAVAAVVVADLPHAQVGLLPSSALARPMQGRLGGRMAQLIANTRPQVINVSQDLSAAMLECGDTFGDVFRRYRDDILFILAAGNDGVSAFDDLCPGGMGHQFDNVITVAGVDAGGCLTTTSNYGKRLASMAATSCPAFRGRFGVEEAFTRGCGTSFAAAVVSNAALRLFALSPSLAPSQVKAMLMERCDDSGIDVACGGQLDMGKISELEAMLAAERESAP